ncbi:MAG: GAF domain-containing protein [Elusimicrobia bacterium]|nr:GAF domain-containing protein [Elusimicrobiota bacterium]
MNKSPDNARQETNAEESARRHQRYFEISFYAVNLLALGLLTHEIIAHHLFHSPTKNVHTVLAMLAMSGVAIIPITYFTLRKIRTYASELPGKEAEIANLHHQIEFILAQTKTGLDIIDTDYNLKFVDAGWQHIYGNPSGRKCYEYFMGLERPCPNCAIAKALETKRTVVSEETLPREGSRPVEVTTIPYQDTDGKWLVAELNVDISERKKQSDMMRSHNKELLALVAASNRILSIPDKSQLCRSICEQAATIAGADYVWLGLLSSMPERLNTCHFSDEGKTYLEEVPAAGKTDTPELVALDTMTPFLCTAYNAADMSEKWKGDMRRLNATAAFSIPITGNEGEPLGVLTLLSAQAEHFTEQRRELYQVFCNQVAVSMENLRIMTELEMKVEERTLELKTQKILAEEARVLAESANKAKSQFLANMSHELRTPLNVVIGCSDIITANMYGELNQKQREYMEFIKNSAHHLLSLINDILDLSKIEYGKMELKLTPIKLRPMLETIAKLLGERGVRGQVSLRLELPSESELECLADQRKLKQIIFNLASNAIKFSPPQSEVVISAASLKDKSLLPRTAELRDGADSYLLVRIRDTGIGIKQSDLGKLFQTFTQLDSASSREYEGSGLGLALTKKLVELHGGAIWAESEYGKGSVFSFALPQNAAMEENNAAKP